MAGKSPEDQHPVKAYGWAARDTSGILSPFKFSRRATGDHDVRVKILYCGICHSDHQAATNLMGFYTYPIVPGFETVGVASEVGSKVTKVKVGDKVATGIIVGSCGECNECINDRDCYCPKMTAAYGSVDRDGTPNYGGFSNETVVNENFVFRFPENLSLPGGAPLLNAGITVYSPMRFYGLDKPGMHLGVVGLGGLGHLAVKFGKAFGAKVTVISTSPSKKDEAVNFLGADGFLVSSDAEQMKAAAGTLDGIIDTVPVVHPIEPLLWLLKNHSKLVLVGATGGSFDLPILPLALGRRTVASSIGGSTKEAQEMLDFAAEHNITANVEIIPMDYVNTAMERIDKSDVRYRFVIDIGNTLTPPPES
ncbi:hypothetical protein M9H77_12975 [Catharanthus roseus]|uniref:Uncharacterized protein n=1 Tax=Catharanthus roseus TaxID=4058 RepID=A0ACC0BJ39_CATRO|nr:hypothetical protein M9H77_12975 [Catharanthus roseus]